MPAPPQPFVFISYAWESDAFRAQVKALRDYLQTNLQTNRITVVSDFDHATTPPDLGWPIWMQHSIQNAAVVLLVCSPSYKLRFEKRAPPTSGKGVAWEGAVITQELYNNAQRNHKFYPIFPDPITFADCPTALEAWSNGHAFPSRQADILALIHDRLGLPIAPVGDPGMLASNPFNPWQVAIAPRFFGRDDLLRALHTALDEKRSVSLVGDRRIGKSSLLQAWKTQAQGLGRVVRWLSGELTEAASCTAFIQAITGETIAQDEAECAANALAKWTEQFAVLPPLILLDDAESLLMALPLRLVERLRGLVGQQKLCLVLTVARSLGQIYRDWGKTSPLLNMLEVRSVGLLDYLDAEQIIKLGDGVFDDEQRALMRCWAGQHPYFLTMYGRKLWEASKSGMPHRQMMDELNGEIAGPMQEIWFTLSKKEQAMLIKIADGTVVDTQGTFLSSRGLVLAGTHGDSLFGQALTLWIKGYANQRKQ